MPYKLLIIEDEYEIRNGLINQIDWEEIGFEIAGEAKNGREALDMISSLTPDAIITDIRMPVMDGIELMRRLRESNSKIRIVILSGYKEFEYAKKSIQYGAFGYILKPTRDEEIYDIFKSLKNKLDNDYNIDSEYESYRNKAKVGLTAIKSILIRKLFENNYKEYEKESILGNLIENGMNVDNYTGIITCAINNGRDGIDEEVFRNKFYEGILRSNTADVNVEISDLFVAGESSILCFIISSKMPVSRYESINIAEKIKENLEHFISDIVPQTCCFSVGIGNFYKDIFNIHESYLQSKRALDLKFFLGLGKIAHIDDCSNFQRIYSTEDSAETEDEYGLISVIADNIIGLKYEHLKESISNYLNYIRKKTQEPEQIYINTIEMIIILNSRFFEKGISIDKILVENVHTDIHEIISTGTFNDLRSYLFDTAVNIANHIEGKIVDDDMLISQAKRFVNEHYGERITLEDVARFVSMSPTYFSSKFKRKTGQPFIKYLTSVRIEKAKILLIRPNAMIKEVAMDVGFNDIRHFSKIFKKVEGTIPSEYKVTGQSMK